MVMMMVVVTEPAGHHNYAGRITIAPIVTVVMVVMMVMPAFNVKLRKLHVIAGTFRSGAINCLQLL